MDDSTQNTEVAKAKQMAADLVSDATHTAENLVKKATETAEKLLEANDDRTTKTLADALRTVFGENQDARRFVDVSRVPLICASIVGIHESLKELKTMVQDADEKYVSQLEFKPVRSIVFGGVGLICVGAIGALLKLIFIP